jgi:hypothetical protein
LRGEAFLPKYFNDFSDDRNKAWCLHCGGSIGHRKTNREHIPTKSLLSKPFPDNLPVANVCADCNEGFSLDEEYFVAFLSAVLSGSTDPEDQKIQSAARILSENSALQGRLNRSKKSFNTIGGDTRVLWEPEWPRVARVLEKNARGHLFYENGEPIFEDPSSIDVFPLPTASDHQIRDFFGADLNQSTWPEVSSRWMQRLFEDRDFDNEGFLVVQPDIYRFKLEFDRGVTVKSILYEYLATSVEWRFQ